MIAFTLAPHLDHRDVPAGIRARCWSHHEYLDPLVPRQVGRKTPPGDVPVCGVRRKTPPATAGVAFLRRIRHQPQIWKTGRSTTATGANRTTGGRS